MNSEFSAPPFPLFSFQSLGTESQNRIADSSPEPEYPEHQAKTPPTPQPQSRDHKVGVSFAWQSEPEQSRMQSRQGLSRQPVLCFWQHRRTFDTRARSFTSRGIAPVCCSSIHIMRNYYRIAIDSGLFTVYIIPLLDPTAKELSCATRPPTFRRIKPC